MKSGSERLPAYAKPIIIYCAIPASSTPDVPPSAGCSEPRHGCTHASGSSSISRCQCYMASTPTPSHQLQSMCNHWLHPHMASHHAQPRPPRPQHAPSARHAQSGHERVPVKQEVAGHARSVMRCDVMPSGQVAINLAVLGVTLKVLALNQRLNRLLDDHGVGHKACRQLARHLGDDVVVVQTLQVVVVVGCECGVTDCMRQV